jgi:hydrogenase nickel incorporation protein HypA/HybF
VHEMAISESIVSLLEEEARRQHYARVRKVWLEIGPLSGIETEALRFTFDVAAKGTLAEDAKLEIIETEALGWCLPCERVVPIRQRFDACPRCGAHQLQVTAGEGMRIKELEVD